MDLGLIINWTGFIRFIDLFERTFCFVLSYFDFLILRFYYYCCF